MDLSDLVQNPCTGYAVHRRNRCLHFRMDLGDVGIGLMTIFNTGILYLLGGQALSALKEFESTK